MIHTDAKQRRLRVLFGQLRWIKQVRPPLTDDPVELAQHEKGKHEAIEKIERWIEREMEDV